MKKLFLLTLALAMTVSLFACGGDANTPNESSKPSESSKPVDSVAMVDITTDDGISLKLPSDMTKQDNGAYANTLKSDIAAMLVLEASEEPYSQWAQEDFVASELSDRDDLVVKSYENNTQINGKDALICTSTFTTKEGVPIVSTLVLVTDGVSEYIITFMYKADNADGSLAKNLQDCVDSIMMKAA